DLWRVNYSLTSSMVLIGVLYLFFFFSSRRRHTRFSRDWSSDVCSSDLLKVDLAEIVGDLVDRFGTRTRELLGDRGELDRILAARSEERRVGKECRSRRSTDHEKKKRCYIGETERGRG